MRLMRAHRIFVFLFVSSFFLSVVDVSVSAPWNDFASKFGWLTRGSEMIPDKVISAVKVNPPQKTIVDGNVYSGLEKFKELLDRLGYIDFGLDNDDKFNDDLKSAIMEYQKNYNLSVTGVIDMSFYNSMIQPRCGVPDITTVNAATMPAFKPWWKSEKNELSYAFHPRNNVSDRIRTVFREAFDRWSNETSLNFTETATYSSSDIRIGFGKWDGKGGFVGAAYSNYSLHVGAIYLDFNEQYMLLQNMVMHQIGHLLGLEHSHVKESIMYPIVMQEKIDLTDYDRKMIQLVEKNSNNGTGTSSASSRGTTTNSSNGGGDDGSVWQRNLVLGFAFMVFGIFLK